MNVNGEFKFYIEEKVINEKMEDHHLGFYIEGYGRFELDFEA